MYTISAEDAPHGKIRKWKHACFALDIKKKKARFFEGGHIRLDNILGWGPFGDLLKNKPINLNGMLLGTQQKNQDRQMFSSYTSINIFSRFLSDDEMTAITSCKVDTAGDYLAWNETKWRLSGDKAFENKISADIVCQPRNGTSLFFPVQVTWIEAEHTCRKLKGRQWSPSNMEEHAAMVHANKKFSKLREGKCTGYESIWWGQRGKIMDDMQNYIYNVYTNKVMYPGWAEFPKYPFAPGNEERYLGLKVSDVYEDGNYETCVQVDMVDNFETMAYATAACRKEEGFKCCPSCFFKDTSQSGLLVRGLCDESIFYDQYEFDGFLTLEQDLHGNLTYIGMENSVIVYNEQKTNWNWTLLNNPGAYAVSKAHLKTFLLGKHKWTFYGDNCFEDGSEHIVGFSTCLPGSADGVGSEFSCNDGLCIPMERRCDGIYNCPDYSDERNCNKVKYGDEYAKDIIPFKVDNEINIIKTKINVSISLSEILKISEIDSIFALKFVLSIFWIDNRLTYENLRLDPELNRLNADERNEIWVPRLTFWNTRESLKTKNDQETMIQIKREGNMTVGKVNSIDNVFTYKGSQNYLMMRRGYALDFQCEYYMAWYPFDLQKCSILIALSSGDVKYMELVPDILSYTGPMDLSLYFIKDYTIQSTNISDMDTTQKGMIVDVVLGRRLFSYILTVYTPTFLLNVIGHNTNFFKSFFFEAVITVNLTVMLVLTTMFISVSSNLPTTAYIKMIDIWLIFNLVIPFIEVLLHTYIDYLRNDEERDINHHGTTIEVGGEAKNITKVEPVNDDQLNGIESSRYELRSLAVQGSAEADGGKRRSALISRREDIQVQALEDHYREREKFNNERNARKLAIALIFANYIIPTLIIVLLFLTGSSDSGQLMETGVISSCINGFIISSVVCIILYQPILIPNSLTILKFIKN